MTKEFIIKSLFMNVIIVFTFFFIFNLWPFPLIEYRYILAVYGIMFAIMLIFECYGLLSELVTRDRLHLENPNILYLAKFSEYVLLAGFGLFVFSDIILKLVYDWMGWIFITSYIQYIIIHSYYLIYRKEALQNQRAGR